MTPGDISVETSLDAVIVENIGTLEPHIVPVDLSTRVLKRSVYACASSCFRRVINPWDCLVGVDPLTRCQLPGSGTIPELRSA